jgi:diguanylate cyclase (GGDEF)-like protein
MILNLLLPHVWVLFLTSLVSILVGWESWQRRSVPGGKILAVTMFFLAEWTLAAGVEAAVTDQAAKIFWSQVEYIGFTAIPGLFLVFILNYTRELKHLTWTTIFIIWIIPLITLILAWTNDLHHLIWSSFEPGPVQLNVLIYNHGVAFWIFTAYLYLIFLIINFVLIREFILTSRLYRLQIAVMAAASFAPALAGGIYLLRINPIQGLDWTPVSTLITGAAFAWGVFRLNLLDLMPVAREALTMQLQDGMIVLDYQDRLVDINPAARKIFNLGTNLAFGRPVVDLIPALAAHLNDTQPVEIILDPDPLRCVELRISLLYRPPRDVVGKLLLFYDVSRRKLAEQAVQAANEHLQAKLQEIQNLQDKLREESIRDVLTGLYNRRYLDDMLQREISRSSRENKPLTILLLDMDTFKTINDSYGHQSGDLVLQKLGQFLTASTRREDIVCRYGGDEFVVIMPGVDARVARIRGDGLRSEFASRRFLVERKEISTTFSVGLATFPTDGYDLTTLIHACDQALYRAKSGGRNRVEVY